MTEEQEALAKREKKKFKIPWGLVAFYGVCLLLGVLLGKMLDEKEFEDFFRNILPAVLFLVISMYLHFIIHEAGHMVLGWMTGYRFVSFRVGSFMWEKQKDGKIRFSRFSLAGTGGQCLMAPPDYNNGKFPYRLYNLGGGLANFILSGCCVLLMLLPVAEPVALFLNVSAFCGIGLGAVNLIPLKKFNNDGSNLVEIGKSPAAKRAFWLQMRINQETANGVRLKDMPAEWFESQTENRRNVMVTSIDVLAASRLMDGLQLNEAEKLMRSLMKEDCLAGVYKNLLVFELSFLEILKGEAGFYTEKTEDKQVAAFAKAMKNFPSILRWQYAKMKLLQKNETEAEKIKAAFEKMANTYPHPCEIEGEKEMMRLVDAVECS